MRIQFCIFLLFVTGTVSEEEEADTNRVDWTELRQTVATLGTNYKSSFQAIVDAAVKEDTEIGGRISGILRNKFNELGSVLSSVGDKIKKETLKFDDWDSAHVKINLIFKQSKSGIEDDVEKLSMEVQTKISGIFVNLSNNTERLADRIRRQILGLPTSD